MELRASRALVALVAGSVACLLVVVVASSASAQKKGKSIQTEATWIAFDPDAKVVKVKVTKPGRGKAARALKSGQEATFKVKPTGSVLVRTTVAINGKKGELTDIPEGKTVNIYWRPDEDDAKALFARKIDVIFSDEELDEMYGGE